MHRTSLASATRTGYGPSWRMALVVVAGTLLAACASTPDPPYERLQAAQTAISQAEQARVESSASAELREAHLKLAAANDAVRDEDMERAAMLAEESRAAAELAFAKSEATRADRVNADLEESVDAIEQDLERNDGEPQ